jgi:lipopolysaccharide transport system permease protein
MLKTKSTKWDWEISSKSSWWDIDIKEWWIYRHLLARLVRRDFLLNYQQTVLGPAWIVLQPILTLIIYVLVFGKIIGVPIGNTDPVLFYLSGIILWNFFNETFLGTAFTFTQNAYLFSKVYFPRLTIPLSSLASNLLRFFIQLLLLLIVMTYYYFFKHIPVQLNYWTLALPIVLLLTGLTGFASGIIFSILTAKYRDLVNVVHLGIRLLMFVTPVLYPYSVISKKMNFKWIVNLNPLSSLFEVFRYGLLGTGQFSYGQLGYSLTFTVLIFIASLSIFGRQGDKLMDVV